MTELRKSKRNNTVTQLKVLKDPAKTILGLKFLGIALSQKIYKIKGNEDILWVDDYTDNKEQTENHGKENKIKQLKKRKQSLM